MTDEQATYEEQTMTDEQEQRDPLALAYAMALEHYDAWELCQRGDGEECPRPSADNCLCPLHGGVNLDRRADFYDLDIERQLRRGHAVDETRGGAAMASERARENL